MAGNLTGINWGEFDKFSWALEKYMPDRGQGETKASQAVTATNKLIYKWYNDGDVYDNTHFLYGWLNDLSDYANWIREHIDGAKPTLDKVWEARHGNDYEHLLFELATFIFEEDRLAWWAQIPAQGDIYNCEGPYKFEEPQDDYDEEDW